MTISPPWALGVGVVLAGIATVLIVDDHHREARRRQKESAARASVRMARELPSLTEELPAPVTLPPPIAADEYWDPCGNGPQRLALIASKENRDAQ